MSIQNKRKESLFFRAIASIISEKVVNSNLSYTTVTEVRLSKDGSHLSIYVSFEKNAFKSLEALNNAKGFIRSELARVGSQRIIPSLTFKIDETELNARRIEKIIADINKK